MALKIIKIAVTSETKFDLSPTVTRFFYETTELIQGEDTVKIDAGAFLDDTGSAVDSLPELNINNSYFNVYINGVLQMDENFAYTAGEVGVGNLFISVPEDSEIPAGIPVIIEVVNYDPITKTTTET